MPQGKIRTLYGEQFEAKQTHAQIGYLQKQEEGYVLMIEFHDPQPRTSFTYSGFGFDSLDISLIDANLRNESLTISPIE